MELIGVPFDGCGKRPGSRLGPAAVRLANLLEVMDSIGIPISDSGDIPLLQKEGTGKGLRQFEAGYECIKELKHRVAASLARGETPLVVGGDHFISVGSVGAALDQFGES